MEQQGVPATCPVAQGSMARIGAVAFIHRFGALLNPHLHFHCVVVDGVFEAGSEAELPVRFYETLALSAKQLTDTQGNIRRRLLRAGDMRIVAIINEGPVIREIRTPGRADLGHFSGAGARSAAEGAAAGRSGRAGNRSAGPAAAGLQTARQYPLCGR